MNARMEVRPRDRILKSKVMDVTVTNVGWRVEVWGMRGGGGHSVYVVGTVVVRMYLCTTGAVVLVSGTGVLGTVQ